MPWRPRGWNLALSLLWPGVQSLVRELRFHKPRGKPRGIAKKTPTNNHPPQHPATHPDCGLDHELLSAEFRLKILKSAINHSI